MAKYNPLPRVELKNRQWPGKNITKEPVYCSVDLRDGNQALNIPMSVEKKIEMFKLLVDIGFKEIEVGFPSASQTDFDFIRKLIDEKLIPSDVTIQVLTQAREHLIRRTFESIKGAKEAIIHVYNSTSPLQRKITFNLPKDKIKQLAIDGVSLIRKLVPTIPDTKIRLEYSPESFSDTETDYALEVCEAVIEAWAPQPEEKVIINLPETVQWAGPHIHADQIEWFCTHMKYRDKAIISLHTHNDRGTGVASTELGLLAGADRVEGTLFGNGERTGNLDIVTFVLNMFSDGIDISLDFSNLPHIRNVYERCTGMDVHPRHPYAGDLVFTAFSGSHQDAIKKGFDKRAQLTDENAPWEVPYLPIDPQDIGRNYEAIIRINSQSGKGGVAHVLARIAGLEIPKAMQPEIGTIINDMSDQLGREISPEEIYEKFKEVYYKEKSPLEIVSLNIHPFQVDDDTVEISVDVKNAGEKFQLSGKGNGPIDAFVQAIAAMGWKDFELTHFYEQSLGSGANSEAVAYVELEKNNGERTWGVGKATSITMAGLKALVSSYNRGH